MLNLDTHIVVRTLDGSLSAEEERLLRSDEWGISAIVLWELNKLVQLNRIQLNVDGEEFERFIADLTVWPITLEVCRAIRRLDFKSDPADELIAATSLVHGVPLMTRDRAIRQSRVVRFAI
jgi:PIN domain nuclease of toxin-antitoxin system